MSPKLFDYLLATYVLGRLSWVDGIGPGCLIDKTTEVRIEYLK